MGKMNRIYDFRNKIEISLLELLLLELLELQLLLLLELPAAVERQIPDCSEGL